jgi:hypothetical protein
MVNYSPDSQSVPSGMLYDHLPYKLNTDDYDRVCQIPKKKVSYLVLTLHAVSFFCCLMLLLILPAFLFRGQTLGTYPECSLKTEKWNGIPQLKESC